MTVRARCYGDPHALGAYRVNREVVTAASSASLAACGGRLLRVLVVGAGSATWLESDLGWADLSRDDVSVDRMDILDIAVDTPFAGRCWQSPIEHMPEIPTDTYDFVLASYVLEHVRDLRAASAEIVRVLAVGGRLLVCLPNPTAPEFLVARITPHRFHALFNKGAFETHYAYASIGSLVSMFERHGLQLTADDRGPVTATYLSQVSPRLGRVASVYDRLAAALGVTWLMGDEFLDFVNPASSPSEQLDTPSRGRCS